MDRKEAIEIVRKNFPDSSFTMLREALETLIPELNEGKDEKIRKALIESFKFFVDGFLETPEVGKDDNLLIKDILAWLEKQGLIKELGEYKVKYTQEILENHMNNVSNKDDERLRKTTIGFLKDFADKGYENAIECIDWLEKQAKQKSEFSTVDRDTPNWIGNK